jgi:DNA polymerase-3 subunit gamma/tau
VFGMLHNEERPHKFDTVVGQRHIVEGISNQSREDKWFQVYIFAGQFGGGKTTMARIVALASNCQQKDSNGNPCLECESCKAILTGTTTDIMEIDAASNTGVDSIRDLKEGTGYMPVNLKNKVYIIDEVHMLSKGAFNALLKVLEEPPEYTMFILCTTDLKAIPVTVRSRAATYIFEQIAYSDIYNKLLEVADNHSYGISKDAVALIAKNAQGAMRNAYSLLQQVTSGSSINVEAEDVQRILGLTDPSYLFSLLKNIILANMAECISLVEQAASLGKDMSIMINDLIDIVSDAVIAKSTSVDKIHDTENYKEKLEEIVKISYNEQLCQIADGLMNIRVDLRKCPAKTTVVVGIIRITTSTINAAFLSRIEVIEKALQNGNLPVNVTNPEKSNMEFSEDKSLSPAIIEESMPTDIKHSHTNIVSETYYEEDVAAVDKDICSNATTDLTDTQDFSSIEFQPVENNVLCDKTEIEKNNITDLPDDCGASTYVSEVDVNKNDGRGDDLAADIQNDGTEDENRELTQEIIYADEFDVFSLFDDFNSMSFDNPIEENISVGDSKKNITSKNAENSAKQKQLEERLRLVSEEDKIFSTALQGCKRTMRNGILVLRTPLKPVSIIVQTYLNVSELKEIEVEFDASLSLN